MLDGEQAVVDRFTHLDISLNKDGRTAVDVCVGLKRL